ncbi:MAG: TVP38/TMEM64 family protein [archaeon]
MKSKHKKLGLLLVLIIAVALYFSPVRDLFTQKELIVDFILGFGVFGPIAMVLLQAFQALLPIIPGQVLSVSGGYLFGFIPGTVYNTIGTMIGSSLCYFLSKIYGRKFVLRFVDERELKHLDAFFSKRGWLSLIIARSLPFFPNDAVSICAGISKMRFREFFIGSLIGFLPHFLLLNYFGEELFQGQLNWLSVIIIGLFSALAFIYIFRHQLKIMLFEEIRAVEKDLKIAEKEEHFLVRKIRNWFR